MTGVSSKSLMTGLHELGPLSPNPTQLLESFNEMVESVSSYLKRDQSTIQGIRRTLNRKSTNSEVFFREINQDTPTPGKGIECVTEEFSDHEGFEHVCAIFTSRRRLMKYLAPRKREIYIIGKTLA